MRFGNIKTMLLVLSVIVSTQAFAKWNLTDSKAIEPACLNCCAYPEFQDQCNADAESDSQYRFYVSRTAHGVLSGLPLSMLVYVTYGLPISSLIAIFGYANMGLIASTIFAIGVLDLVNVVIANVYQVSKSILGAKDVQKPEGIVLVIKAKNDWNFAINAYDFSAFKKKHLVLTYTADQIGDVADAIRSVRARFKLPIKALVWTAHGGFIAGAFGYESFVMFGSEYVALSNVYRFKRIFLLLDPDTIIILSSCNTAALENMEAVGQGNVAQGIAFVAEGRKVYSTSDFSTPLFEIDDDLGNPRFRGPMALPFYFIELLSGFKLNFEKYLDLMRCYYSPTDGVVERCPQE